MDEDEELATLLGQWQTHEDQHFQICEQALVQQQQDMEEAMMIYEYDTRIVHCRRSKERHREQSHLRLMDDYFIDDPATKRPTFTETDFRRRNRMHRSLFLRILEGIQNDNRYFQQHPNAAGRLGLSGHQKMTCAMRLLAYATAADSVDEYVRIGETTAIETLKIFCRTIIKLYKSEYLRRPTAADVQRLCSDNAKRGFPGMLGSIDCMHWEWKNCPSEWQGQYIGHVGAHPTVILEAVADKDGWFWHANFGMPGSNNDLNVLHSSDLFDEVLNGTAPECNYTLNGKTYDMGYYLGDGIYPAIAPIVKAYKPPANDVESLFTLYQEARRKDVERAFGMLQGRFHSVREPCRYLDPMVVGDIMITCIILNNMIVEDERLNNRVPLEYDRVPFRRVPLNMQTVMGNYDKVYSALRHEELRTDLQEELWRNKGGHNPILPN